MHSSQEHHAAVLRPLWRDSSRLLFGQPGPVCFSGRNLDMRAFS